MRARPTLRLLLAFCMLIPHPGCASWFYSGDATLHRCLDADRVLEFPAIDLAAHGRHEFTFAHPPSMTFNPSIWIRAESEAERATSQYVSLELVNKAGATIFKREGPLGLTWRTTSYANMTPPWNTILYGSSPPNIELDSWDRYTLIVEVRSDSSDSPVHGCAALIATGWGFSP